MTDAYQFWRARLANKGADLKSLMLPTMYEAGNQDNPQPGVYRTRLRKGGPLAPVQIMLTDEAGVIHHEWRDGLTLTGWIDGKAATADQIADRWHFCEAVSKADIAHHKQNGRWPGEIATVGDNSGDLSLAEEINDAVAQAREWIGKTKITDKTIADEAANRRARLLDLGKKADKERDEKKRPHLEAGRAIDGEYKPLVEAATSAANAIRDALTQWMRVEETRQRAEAEARRKAEEERVAKERAEYLAANPIAEFTEEPPLPLAPVEAPKVQAGGQAGRRAGLRTVVRYEIEDYAAALAHVKDHKDVIAAVEKACFAMAKAGAGVPGVKRIEERVAA